MSLTNRALWFKDDFLHFIDQTLLPLEEVIVSTDSFLRVNEAIKKLEVRGAPAIGIAGAFALALSQKDPLNSPSLSEAYDILVNSRPTAVNLRWALDLLVNSLGGDKQNNLYERLLAEAGKIHEEDIESCSRIGTHGADLFRGPVNILTHCNAGYLATGGDGTALSVIYQLQKRGMLKKVYADETRPLLQGSRLTAYELHKAGIDFMIQPDSAAAYNMQLGNIDAVITGADRIAANGDSANKIGTYSLAVNAAYHNIPFYIAAPFSTIDLNIADKSGIPVEERDPSEVTSVKNIQVTRSDYPVFNPAFDIIPAKLITAIITEKGVYHSPFRFDEPAENN
ncbi:MAG: S-methyl-5-thioribose-1-phosphate isomerase [Ignavibacteriaceae bacterium]|nr:S-methyl-5-thioribose-1-phosphate isomerase [Ignavibacteriaceae bacterium]